MPLQMIGTRRSGSNLLRVMIGQLPGAFAPQSTHVLEYFTPMIPFYGDLNDDMVFSQLVDDMCRCVELNPVEWIGINLDRQIIFKQCKQRSILAVFESIYTLAAHQSDGDIQWMCKCLGYINYFDDFEQYFGDKLKYIYIYRDGRDVALSFTSALAGQKHHYLIAKEWARTQRLALAVKEKLPADRFHAVCYESLLADAESVCRGVADFIGIPYTPDMLKFYESKSAKSSAKSSKLWGNITKPIITDNSKKFLTQSTEEDIRIFESVAGEELEILGYKPIYTNTDYKQSFSAEDIEEFERINKERKENIVSQTNAKDIKRRDGQKIFVDSVRSRLGCEHVDYHGNMLHKKKSVDLVEA